MNLSRASLPEVFDGVFDGVFSGVFGAFLLTLVVFEVALYGRLLIFNPRSNFGCERGDFYFI